MMIPYGRQEVTQKDIDAVVDVLRSDFLTQGRVVPRFEEAVARSCGAAHGIALNSATSALHLACLALGLGAGDWLWTTPITFVASANCALYCGAQVDFVDIDPDSCNLCPKALEAKLVQAEKVGQLPKIVVPVHFRGEPCDMEAIAALGKKYGFKIIEDASHAIGAKYKRLPVGACKHADIAVFSFHPVKIITSGEGGVAVTNDARLADRMALLRSHGITRDSLSMTHAPDGGWYYQQIDLGFNYRMTEMQAALGLSQLARLDDYVGRRHALAKRYDEMLAGLPLVVPRRDSQHHSALHLYVVRLRLSEIPHSRGEIYDALRASGIGVNIHYIPVHTHPYYATKGFKRGDFPVAEAYYAEAISLPLYSTLTERQQDEVVAAVVATLQCDSSGE
jgi:UDP-4-amino-4,6-dideoxy-N-acetyl-beta-L-altrosamine transaminase